MISLGVVSTPVIQHAISRLDAAGGISIGASHNAAEWNALKFFGPRGIYLSTAEAGELLDIYHLQQVRLRRVGPNRQAAARGRRASIRTWTNSPPSTISTSLRRFRVLVDCCNGTSSLILRRMNERFGFDFVLINEQIEGVSFAHEPSTDARKVALQLAPLMRPLCADAGFLFDVDSDRVAIATDDGRAGVARKWCCRCWPITCCRAAAGKLVITNLSSTALLDEVAARHGGKVIRVPVGRQAAIDALSSYRPEQVAMAGEGTGAVMMPQLPLRLRRHRVDAGDSVDDAGARAEAFRDRGELSEVLHPQRRGAAGDAARAGADGRTARAQRRRPHQHRSTASASIGRTAGCTCA